LEHTNHDLFPHFFGVLIQTLVVVVVVVVVAVAVVVADAVVGVVVCNVLFRFAAPQHNDENPPASTLLNRTGKNGQKKNSLFNESVFVVLFCFVLLLRVNSVLRSTLLLTSQIFAAKNRQLKRTTRTTAEWTEILLNLIFAAKHLPLDRQTRTEKTGKATEDKKQKNGSK
jgi:type IV secretory pathway VirB3-like protein